MKKSEYHSFMIIRSINELYMCSYLSQKYLERSFSANFIQLMPQAQPRSFTKRSSINLSSSLKFSFFLLQNFFEFHTSYSFSEWIKEMKALLEPKGWSFHCTIRCSTIFMTCISYSINERKRERERERERRDIPVLFRISYTCRMK